MMYASHVVIDTRDGAVFWNDEFRNLFDEQGAKDFARKRNDALKPEYRTYRVFAVLPTLGELSPVTITRLDDETV